MANSEMGKGFASLEVISVTSQLAILNDSQLRGGEIHPVKVATLKSGINYSTKGGKTEKWQNSSTVSGEQKNGKTYPSMVVKLLGVGTL